MSVEFQRTVPIFRIFDVARAREFYLDYLGFHVDWEHRFTERSPLYMQVSRGALTLHLSEHHGDACPGSTAYVQAAGVHELHAELAGKDYPYLRPGIGESEIGTGLELIDPFGNRLRINEPPAGDDPA
jgi:ribosomal-protein-alanine N-acetyltransferase